MLTDMTIKVNRGIEEKYCIIYALNCILLHPVYSYIWDIQAYILCQKFRQELIEQKAFSAFIFRENEYF
jgi:hypothetical protein